MSLTNSDWIAILAVGVSLFSAFYAWKSALSVSKANQISIDSHLRPARLALYSSLRDFLRFCSTYYTMQCLSLVNGARDIAPRIEAFEWEIEQHGPLNMPLVDELCKEAILHAWQLQRITDRLLGTSPLPLDHQYANAEENRDAILLWFHDRLNSLEATFKPYLLLNH